MTIKLIICLIAAAGAVCMVAKPIRAHAQTRRLAVEVGAERPDLYLPLLKNKRVALLSNHTGLIDSVTHTADYLLAKKVNLTTLMSPEHGFRGKASAGEEVASGKDAATGLPVVSLYGKGRKEALKKAVQGVDVVVVDLQDVGARFYTYHITMAEVMAEAARQGKKVVVFDRPNPLIMTVDGPTLDLSLKSGVGMLPIPAVHGMTMGELALMMNGEGWLEGGVKADLAVVPCGNYGRDVEYELPVAPSPNLRNMGAIYLYPSLCLFEGTPVSVGRGTEWPFQIYGHPAMGAGYVFEFIPTDRPGAMNPPCEGKLCRGMDLRGVPYERIIAGGMNLDYVIDAYNALGMGEAFFTRFFDLLAGTKELRRQIMSGMSAEAIRKTWQPGIKSFLELRKPYLLY